MMIGWFSRVIRVITRLIMVIMVIIATDIRMMIGMRFP